LVVTASGQLFTFGYEGAGQLGNGKTSYEEDPTPEAITLPGATGPPVRVAAGREFSLVLTAHGQLYAFGGDTEGELGNGTTDYEGVSTPEPITLPGATGVLCAHMYWLRHPKLTATFAIARDAQSSSWGAPEWRHAGCRYSDVVRRTARAHWAAD
jgi:alpha-tubulin suppressor-like RCC1 family protein